MKRILPILILLLYPAVMQAQSEPNYTLEYGRANTYELNETQYPFDPEAEAAVIFEIGDYRFVPYETGTSKGLELHMTVTTKIKIYNEAGLDYANFKIPYYFPSQLPEKVRVEGVTYNLDGVNVTRTELSKANIYDEKVHDDYYVKKIAFPNVRAGSVIELKYTISTVYYFNMRTWWFQKKMPVFYSRLSYRALPFYDYAFIAKGLTKFDEHRNVDINVDNHFGRFTYKEQENIYVMKRMPAFRDEEFLLNTDDYMANINFQLASYLSYQTGTKTQIMSTWPELCSDLLKHPDFGKYLEASVKEAKTVLPEIGVAGKSDLEKFEAICDYVKFKYIWNKNTSKYAEKKLTAFLKDKTGNSADINLFMTGLMQAAGLDAYPVALSTQDNGMIHKDYPFSRFLNNVVAMARIDGQDYFADATAPLARYDELPAQCTNVEGLIIMKKEPKWVVLAQNEESADFKEVSMKIMPAEGKISAEMKQTLDGNAAYKKRRTYNGDIEKLKDEYKGNEGMKVVEITTENFQKTAEPFVINMKYDISTGPAGEEPDKIYLNPLLYIAPATSPFKQAERTHPVNLIFHTLSDYKVEIEIPEGYSAEYLPAEFVRSNNIMNISYKTSVEGNKIKLAAGFAMKAFYEPKEYAGLKNMYENMVRAFSEVIILKKD